MFYWLFVVGYWLFVMIKAADTHHH